MGRLSDARKKAKGGAASGAKGGGGADVPAKPPVEIESNEPVSFAAEGRKEIVSPQVQAAQRLADELLAGIDGEEAPAETLAERPAPSVAGKKLLGSSGLAEDFLAGDAPAPVTLPRASAADVLFHDDDDEVDATQDPIASGQVAEGLPSSGLAEDLLAEMERRAALKAAAAAAAAMKPADEFAAAFPAEKNAPAKPNLSADEYSFAHQLGDDVLALMGNEPVRKARGPAVLPSSGLADDILSDMPAPHAKTPLGMDEVHEFEAFFEEERAAEQLQLVLFQMENEIFALEIDRVQEIIRVPAITRVPHSLDAVRGVCNLRGRIVPVLDLRKLMRLVPKTIDRFNRIMVLDVGGKRIGVLIDRVSEVARINVPDVEPPPEELRAVDANLVTAVARLGERMIFILDVDRVLSLK